MFLPRVHRRPFIVAAVALAAAWCCALAAFSPSTARANQLRALVAARCCAQAAYGYMVSDGSLGSLTLGPSDTVGFNTDTGQFSINGGSPISGGVHDANGAMVFNFTTIELHNTTPIVALGTNPLALAATGPVTVGGSINLRGCSPSLCGVVIVAGGGKPGTGGNTVGQGGNGGSGGQNGRNLYGGTGGVGSGPGSGTCPNANGGGGGGGGGGYDGVFSGLGGNGAVTGGGGGGEGGATGNAGGSAVGNVPGAGGTGGSASGGDGSNGNTTGGSAAQAFNGVPNQSGGGGGGAGGGAVGVGNGGNGGNGGFGGGGGGGGGGTKCGNTAGKGGNGAGGAVIISPFGGIGPLLGGGGGGGAGGKSHFGTSTFAPGGGSGGGAIAIDSLASISFISGGLIDARGGDAAPLGSMGDGAGGGGGGGAVCLAAPVISGAAAGTNVLVTGGANSQGQLAGNGVFIVRQIVPCNPDDSITATASCSCADPGATMTFTLHNNSASAIYLSNSAPFEIRNSMGQVVYRPPCVTQQIVTLPAGQSQNFIWDQKNWGNQTLNGCQWNNAAQVPNGSYTFAVSFCTDADCTGQSVRCVSAQIGNCVTVSTDKDCYAPGEHVTVTITNNGCCLINLRNLVPWEIRDPLDNLVYRPACAPQQIVPLNPGESYTFTGGGGAFDGTTWDQLDDGNGLLGCGYSNRAQVPNGTYQACATYTDAAFGPNTTVCSNFKIANNCVAVDPDCPCNMSGGLVRVTITNGSSQPIGLPNQQPWRIRNLSGTVVFAPAPSGPPVQLNPSDTYSVYWDQNNQQGQLAPSGNYSAEFDYIEMPNTPRIGRGGLQLGGCLKLTLDQDCYAPGADVKIKVVNTSCQQLFLSICDAGPVMIVNDQDDPIWFYPCDIACNSSRIMQPGEMRSWTWDQKDQGNNTHGTCPVNTWNNAQQVPNGHYCADVPYSSWPLPPARAFTAQQCFDIGADCADVSADKPCYEDGEPTCFTLSNHIGNAITVDKPWRILDANGNDVHPGGQCFIFWIPPVIADGSCRQFCWDQQTCFAPPPLGPGSYTFEVHFTEADGTEHTYRQDFSIVVAGGCEPPPADCNNNGIADTQDISAGMSLDCNANLVPDECEYPLCQALTKGDLNCDGNVNGMDAQGFVNHLTAGAYTCQADLNGDGLADLIDVPDFVSLLLCWPNCPPSGPQIRSDSLCYVSGTTAVIHVDTAPATSGSIHFRLFEVLGNGSGTLAFEETRPLNGSSTYNFSAPLSNVGRYVALAEVLNMAGDVVGMDSLILGARPNLPGIPSDICTFEAFTVNASALRSAVEAAVANHAPMTLSIGSRSYEVLLEEASGLASSSVHASIPTLGLFRGRVACNPNSEVRLTFAEGLVHALVDQGASDSAVYMEPGFAYDQGLPFNQYVGYESDDVRFSSQDDAASSPLGPAGGTGNLVGEPDNCPQAHRIDVNLYWDNDPNNTRIADFNNIDATFTNNFPAVNGPLLVTLLHLSSDTQINTDAYADDPALLMSFTNDPAATTAGVDVAMLFTDNSLNIDYGNTLGRGWWQPGQYAGANHAYCWVKRTNAVSAHQRRIVGCHELAHNLGASNNCPGACPEPTDPEDVTGTNCSCQNQCGNCQCAHNNNIVRRECLIYLPHDPAPLCVSWRDHYSIMKCVYDTDATMDPVWVQADLDTLRKTIKNTAGHFCNP